MKVIAWMSWNGDLACFAWMFEVAVVAFDLHHMPPFAL
jgi:hypothetical protein